MQWGRALREAGRRHAGARKAPPLVGPQERAVHYHLHCGRRALRAARRLHRAPLRERPPPRRRRRASGRVWRGVPTVLRLACVPCSLSLSLSPTRLPRRSRRAAPSLGHRTTRRVRPDAERPPLRARRVVRAALVGRGPPYRVRQLPRRGRRAGSRCRRGLLPQQQREPLPPVRVREPPRDRSRLGPSLCLRAALPAPRSPHPAPGTRAPDIISPV